MSDPSRTEGAFSPRRASLILVVLVVLSVISFGFGVVHGPTEVDVFDVLRGTAAPDDHFKVTVVRLPKAAAAMIVGAALALAGAVFQALIHNALASPYVLGVSAGGSLGAVLAIALGFSFIVPFAFLGAIFAIVLVYAVARTRGRVPPDTLLLAGVLVNTFFSACILLVTYLTATDRTMYIMRWLVGGLAEYYEWKTLLPCAALLALFGAVVWFMARPLNLIAMGDDVAERLGVDVGRTRTLLFFAGSMLTAIAVSISGPIGFVGLIVPHILRLACGPDHRLLIPASSLVGGSFIVVADTVAASDFTPPLPVGLVTAFIGGPFFIWLMKARGMGRDRHGR